MVQLGFHVGTELGVREGQSKASGQAIHGGALSGTLHGLRGLSRRDGWRLVSYSSGVGMVARGKRCHGD
jgi:hypothetical protein